VFGTVLTILFFLLLSHILWRAGQSPWMGPGTRKRRLWGAGWLIGSLFLLGRTVGRSGTGPWADAFRGIGMDLLGLVFIAWALLVLVEAATLFGLFFRKQAPALRGWALLAGVALSLFALIQGHRPPAVGSHEVTLTGLPPALDGTVLVALSDTHLGSRIGADWFAARMEQVHALKPDLLVFLGDTFDGRDPRPKDLPSLRRLEVPFGKWHVSGNHDGRRPGTGSADILAEAGSRLLSNEWAEPAPGLVVAGVEDLTRHARRGGGEDLIARALEGRPKGAAILLSHTPWMAERASASGAGLMLSGHTHGGQVWPFGCLVRLSYPLLSGRYLVEGTTVIVSRGAGTWGPRMRLWRRGEILRITLRSPGKG